MEEDNSEEGNPLIVPDKRKKFPSRKVPGTPSPAVTSKRRARKENCPPTLKIMPTINHAKTPKASAEALNVSNPSSSESSELFQCILSECSLPNFLYFF